MNEELGFNRLAALTFMCWQRLDAVLEDGQQRTHSTAGANFVTVRFVNSCELVMPGANFGREG